MTNKNMRGPDGCFIGEIGDARVRDQDTRFRTFRFDEHFRECRVRLIGRVGRHRQFQVTGEFELAGAQGPVGNFDAAQFHVVLGSDRRIQNGLDPGHAAMDFGAVGSKPDGDLSLAGRKRLMRRRPYLIRLQVANKEETAPRDREWCSERHRVTSGSPARRL